MVKHFELCNEWVETLRNLVSMNYCLVVMMNECDNMIHHEIFWMYDFKCMDLNWLPKYIFVFSLIIVNYEYDTIVKLN